MTCPYCTHCREVAGGPYRCCLHCAEDSIHDVPKDGHDLPCTSCSEGSEPAEPEPTACPNGDEGCPGEYLCAECYEDGREQAAIDAEDARQGR